MQCNETPSGAYLVLSTMGQILNTPYFRKSALLDEAGLQEVLKLWINIRSVRWLNFTLLYVHGRSSITSRTCVCGTGEAERLPLTVCWKIWGNVECCMCTVIWQRWRITSTAQSKYFYSSFLPWLRCPQSCRLSWPSDHQPSTDPPSITTKHTYYNTLVQHIQHSSMCYKEIS